jgi:hypothetical protein
MGDVVARSRSRRAVPTSTTHGLGRLRLPPAECNIRRPSGLIAYPALHARPAGCCFLLRSIQGVRHLPSFIPCSKLTKQFSARTAEARYFGSARTPGWKARFGQAVVLWRAVVRRHLRLQLDAVVRRMVFLRITKFHAGRRSGMEGERPTGGGQDRRGAALVGHRQAGSCQRRRRNERRDRSPLTHRPVPFSTGTCSPDHPLPYFDVTARLVVGAAVPGGRDFNLCHSGFRLSGF